MKRRWFGILGLLLGVAVGSSAWAKLTAEEIARLGKDLTPLGAEKAGNKEGTIPEWEGGLTKPPAGWVTGKKYVDPFAADKPLFAISPENVVKYADKLTEGQKALLKAYKTYRINVYPTRRSFAAPERVYEGTKKTAATAALVQGGNGITGVIGGVPFPIPKTAQEVLWNHLLRWHTQGFERDYVVAAVTRGGDYALTKAHDWAILNYWLPGMTEKSLNNILWMYKQDIVSPPRLAGRVLLLQETINQAQEARKAWIYNPGQRRVRRAPEYAFDNPWEGSDGLMTIDQQDGFNGSPERYDWTLVGKKEIYVPYNAYRLTMPPLKYKELLTALHPNPAPLRYELHRVWVIDGRLKKGERHLYARRTLYVDEDSWMSISSDLYDSRGQLWRVGETHTMIFPDAPGMWYVGEFNYDLQVGRYAAGWLHSEEKPWNVTKVLSLDEFTPDALRRAGTR